MYDAPEGYVIEDLDPGEAENITEVALRIYRKGEPLCDYIGMSEGDLEELLKPLLTEWIECGCSVVTKSSETNEIVGLLLAKPLTSEDQLIWGKYKPTSEKAKYYAEICAELETGVDVADHYGVDCVIDHSFLAVQEEHRGRGIGLSMAKAIEEIGRGKDIKTSAVTASNTYTARIYRKLGFKVLFEYNYEDLEMNGTSLYDLTVSNGTQAAQVLGKKVE